jgi:hypothetical protein
MANNVTVRAKPKSPIYLGIGNFERILYEVLNTLKNYDGIIYIEWRTMIMIK